MTVRKYYRLKPSVQQDEWRAEHAGNHLVLVSRGSMNIWLSEDQFSALFEEKSMEVEMTAQEAMALRDATL